MREYDRNSYSRCRRYHLWISLLIGGKLGNLLEILVHPDDAANEELECDFIPTAWNINRERLTHKIEELLDDEWVARVREGFIETLNTALQQ